MRASLASIAALAISIAVSGCGPSDEEKSSAAQATEERLDQVLRDVVDAIQAKQPAFIMDHVAEEFVDEGGLDYFGVRSLVEAYAFRDEEIGARLESVEITPSGEGEQHVEARVAFTVGQRIPEGAELPADATIYSFEVVFELRATRWLAVRGRYRRE